MPYAGAGAKPNLFGLLQYHQETYICPMVRGLPRQRITYSTGITPRPPLSEAPCLPPCNGAYVTLFIKFSDYQITN
jgi:hypothetical protein